MPSDLQSEQRPNFWCSPCGRAGKCLLLLALLAAFAGQTILVYADPLVGERLSPEGKRGRQIWYANNCQACHQLYGFGGFLGPDLTNSAKKLSPERLKEVLTNGIDAMPAFRMSAEEISAVSQFLTEIDETGRGQARKLDLGDPLPVILSFENEVGDRLSGEVSPASLGFDLVKAKQCHACHVPFQRGSTGAADMSRVVERLTDEEILSVLETGRGIAMPDPELTADERASVLAYLKWLNTNSGELMETLDMGDADSIDFLSVPWWEYP